MELSGESEKLAIAEAMALGNASDETIDGRALLITSDVSAEILVTRGPKVS